MRKRALVAGLALALSTASAFAADLPSLKAPIVAPPPAFSWTGLYGGVNIGYGFGNSDQDPGWMQYQTFVLTCCTIDIPAPAWSISNDPHGVLGGGQFGFIYQRGPLVIGPEVDLGGIGISGTAREPGGPLLAKSSSGFYGDFTGRLGYAFGPALVYLKGGYAYFGGDVNLNDVASVHTVSGTNGFTLGGGLEYRINPAWSVKGEYQYIDLGSHNVLMPSGNIYNYDLNVQAVKFGVNFHFPGGYAAPLK